MTKIVKLANRALDIISSTGVENPDEAWSYIRKQFSHMDLPLIISLSEAGDDGALGCLDRMIGHYRDDRRRTLSLHEIRDVIGEELEIDMNVPSESDGEGGQVIFADGYTVVTSRTDHGHRIIVNKLSHDKRDDKAVARFERLMGLFSGREGTVSVSESRWWKTGGLTTYEDGINILSRSS